MADGAYPALERLLKSANPREQLALRRELGAPISLNELRQGYLTNPFLQLTQEEAERLGAESGPLAALIAARHAAQSFVSPRYVVFCMPKSGSSFVRWALREALQLPDESLTGFGSAALNSYFGMNGREQELDELAVIRAVLRSPGGFVAQHHTRYTQFLALQMAAYRLRPIVTIRNVLDSLVSFDDMMLQWRAGLLPEEAWTTDPYALPQDYVQREPVERYDLLAHTLGLWQIQFLLSWKRCMRQNLVRPLFIRYEVDVLDPERFVATLTRELGLTEPQCARLQASAAKPDQTRSRLNVGRAGRGREKVADKTRRFLRTYAETFGEEFAARELDELLG